MRRIFIIFAVMALVTGNFAAEITDCWGIVSFRQRHEETEDFYSQPGSANFGDAYLTRTNTKTRIGYQFGLRVKIEDYLSAGLTFRSGLRPDVKGSVMLQDIDNRSGLVPGLQHAYLDWRPPYFDLLLGKFPQEGNALWDIYAAHKQTDFRTDDPRDGIFNDRMAALNGVKLSTSVGPLTLRAVYHIDYVGGSRTEFAESSADDQNNPDKYVYLFGGQLRVSELTMPLLAGVSQHIPAWLDFSDMFDNFNLDVEGDYGFPYRSADFYQAGADSVYLDETLWGIGVSTGLPWMQLNFGYAYDYRDSVFTSRFWDYMLELGLPEMITTDFWEDFRLTARYQYHSQQNEFGIYNNTRAVRDALFLYLDKKIWDLNFQPRIIWFKTEINGTKIETNMRIELTTTVRFDLN